MVQNLQYSEKILSIRKAVNMSQEEFARQLDVSFATVNRWENGKSNPSRMAINTIKEFCMKHNIINLLDRSDSNDDK
jgi:DNA-binding transcriptional regulator YiaG